ncbi:MAG TPA: hypothetical protein VF530_21325 [Planctomycetota bacterium]
MRTVLAAALVPLLASDPAPSGDPGYVLHEWGTFTTVVGSDGVLLEGLSYEDHALPDFVHQARTSRPGFAGVRGKMETPVIYVYSDRERELRLRVGFQPGLLTQWYPQVAELYPPVGGEAPLRGDVPLRGGLLDWGVLRVLAPGDGLAQLPAVGAAHVWEHARAVDANVLERPATGEHERFLFYRGLGSFALPLAVRADPDRRLQLVNVGDEPIPGAVVLARRGAELRASFLPALAPDTPVQVKECDLAPIEPGALMARTAQLLVAQGLYPREAEAMVNTWQHSYFEVEGLRVLYPLPRAQTDWLLPLYVAPPPRESVRVLVGRTDVLTNEEEQRALALAPRLTTAEEARSELGRFAPAVLRRLETLAREGRERDHVRELRELVERTF